MGRAFKYFIPSAHTIKYLGFGWGIIHIGEDIYIKAGISYLFIY